MKKRLYFYVKTALLCAFCAVFAYFVLTKPAVVSAGIKRGLLTVGGALLPTLFPFMALACFIENSGVSHFIGKALSPVTRFVFRLPREASAAVVMSFIGGYPVGGKMTESLLKEEKITKKQAARMYLFCVNGGPAFILSTVGAGLLNSARAGALLFCSTTLSSLIIGFLSGFIFASPVTEGDKRLNGNGEIKISEAVTKSASQTVTSFLSVSVYVMIFSALCEIIGQLNLSEKNLAFLFSVSEVTNGALFCCGKMSLPVIAAVIGFGGLCVHFQIMNGVLESGLKLKYFFISRIVCAALSSGICRALVYFFPVEISVFAPSGKTAVLPYSISLPCCIAFALMSACLIFDIAPKKKV